MLNGTRQGLVEALIEGASKEELIWLSGYLAGVAGTSLQKSAAPTPAVGLGAGAAPAVGKITIAYGTETGNAKRLATDFAARAKKQGIQSKLVNLEQYRLNDLSKEEYFLTVISTQGDGEPPAGAKKFYDHLHQGEQKLDRLKYSVLALGDTAYPLFCKAGEDVDQQLEKMGGRRIQALQKCDVDYEGAAGEWFGEVLRTLGGGQIAGAGQATGAVPSGQAQGLVPAPGGASPEAPAFAAGAVHSKKIHRGTVLANINLNDRGSAKQTHHLEIAAEGVDYQPGDAIGIHPENPKTTVQAILDLVGIDGARSVRLGVEEKTIADWLTKKRNIVHLPVRVVRKYAGVVGQEIPETQMGLLDLLKIYPVKDTAQFLEVLAILEPIAPRLYSVSSSPEAHAGEIHLTVARDKFSVNGEPKYGLCSDVLVQLGAGQALDFYIHRNARFKLPPEDKDVIMVGPGTGVAPFRSFLAERDSLGATGRNWLFFGDQHFVSDFLYQTEIQDWLGTGVLTRVNTAFSRDQAEKIYVQHRMREQGAELFEWLEAGAYFYVCGAKDPMSVDVEAMLLEIIRQAGVQDAEDYLEDLKITGRYVKDVY